AELVARERGYSMVLRSERLPVLNDPEPLSSQISGRALVWHDASSDITDEVLKRLNEAYAEQKKKDKKDKDF
ncbi:MAG TPA: hypothetical protein VEN81_12075, partial [Planctomycetota bacterium]|nr:hypothetical protein [Planctomycetota bacterium]